MLGELPSRLVTPIGDDCAVATGRWPGSQRGEKRSAAAIMAFGTAEGCLSHSQGDGDEAGLAEPSVSRGTSSAMHPTGRLDHFTRGAFSVPRAVRVRMLSARHSRRCPGLAAASSIFAGWMWVCTARRGLLWSIGC